MFSEQEKAVRKLVGKLRSNTKRTGKNTGLNQKVINIWIIYLHGAIDYPIQ